MLPIVTPADLAKVPVKGADEPPVAVVRPRSATWRSSRKTHQPLIGDAVVNSEPGILLVVEKLPWANTLELTSGVETAIAELQPGLPDVKFDTHVFQQADFVKLADLEPLPVAAPGVPARRGHPDAVPLRVARGADQPAHHPAVARGHPAGAPLAGATINTMTLAGLVIALGAVVDDAIIDVENIVRRLRERRLSGSSESTASVILHASLEVRSPIVYATLIIVAAAVPVFLLQG